jgi:hypothetical protein
MPARILALVCMTVVAVCVAAQAPSSDQLNQPHIQPPPAPASRAATPARVPPLPPAGKDLQADLERMRALLVQMRNNLAFVQTTQTPLKHQFELECDMWQLLITDMEHRLDRPASAPEQKR